MKRWSYKAIQDDVIKRYKIDIGDLRGNNARSKHWRKVHGHIKERKVYHWASENSAKSTFDLLYEIGRIETYTKKEKVCSNEYHAVQWAADKAKEYNMVIPNSIRQLYQNYIDANLQDEYQQDKGKYALLYTVKW